MSVVWTVVAVVGVATIVIKALGPALLGGRVIPPRILGVVSLLAPALLTALVVTNTIAGERRIVADPRLAGVALAGAALLARAPLLVAVILAAATTALIRALH
jgi:branched-subunit amino acid transport protein